MPGPLADSCLKNCRSRQKVTASRFVLISYFSRKKRSSNVYQQVERTRTMVKFQIQSQFFSFNFNYYYYYISGTAQSLRFYGVWCSSNLCWDIMPRCHSFIWILKPCLTTTFLKTHIETCPGSFNLNSFFTLFGVCYSLLGAWEMRWQAKVSTKA